MMVAVDSAVRHALCVRLTDKEPLQLYAVAAVAVTDGGDVEAVYHTAAGGEEEAREHMELFEEALLEWLGYGHICVVDGYRDAPSCTRIIRVIKSGRPPPGAVATLQGYIVGANPEEVEKAAALNALAHAFANELVAVLWRQWRVENSCVVPRGAHPAMLRGTDASLF
jgi:hypothetical protein